MISAFISVEDCLLRKPHSRELYDSDALPPPTTIYGMFLSYIGEYDREKYRGTQMAICVIRHPKKSWILRKNWRTKFANVPPGCGKNVRPEFLAIQVGLEFAVWLNGPIVPVLKHAVERPEEVDRYGCLSFGDSNGNIEELKFYPTWPTGKTGDWMVPSQRGKYPLPLWSDYDTLREAVWQRFDLILGPIKEPHTDCWFTIP